MSRWYGMLFMQDWWTCTSFSSYYRKWNTLIHDWIRTYIYQDFKTVSTFDDILLILGACTRVAVITLSVCLSVTNLAPLYDVCATN